jgi:prephenate dehydratase
VSALRIAHLGSSGSFSEEAALEHARAAGVEAELVPAPTFASVLDALARGAAERAVLPIASTGGGLVLAALAALSGRRFALAGELALPVRLSLWVRRAELAPASLARVASHPQALRQCARTLARLVPSCAPLEWSDTASAARDLASGLLDERTAVLASARAGERHGLHALAVDVQDEPDNRTLFAVLRRDGRDGVE